MKILTNTLNMVMLSLILIFTISTSKAQHNLERQTAFMFEQSRQYTDNRMIESQVKTLTVVSDITKSTRLLALIICRKENDRTLCSDNTTPDKEPK